MKNLFISIIFLLFVFNSAIYSQESKEKSVLKDEVSISASNLKFDNLSLKYAKLISTDLWLKLGVINLSGGVHKNFPTMGDYNSKDSRFNGGLLIGIDRQKSLTQKLEILYGLNLQMSYNYSLHNNENPSLPMSQRNIKVNNYNPGLGFGLGVFYKINRSVLFGFEVNPSICYSFTNGNLSNNGLPYKNRGFDFSFNNNVAQVTLKYRL